MSALDMKKSGKNRMHSGKKLAPLSGAEPAKRFTKKELVEACRKNGPGTDQAAILLRRKMRLNNVTPGVRAEDPDVGSQVVVMDNGVKTNAKKLNDENDRRAKLRSKLVKLNDELVDIERNDNGLNEMITGTNPESARIRELIKEIEKVNMATEKKLHYRLQLQHMQARLKMNSVTLDAHLNAMEDTHAGAEKELLHCENLMREVEADRTKAARDYEATLASVTIERQDRERILKSKKNEEKNAKKMESWRKKTEIKQMELAQKQRGDMNEEAEDQLRRDHRRTEAEKDYNAQRNGEALAMMLELEKGFEEVNKATGVSSLAEMVNKFANHQKHKDNLTQENKEAGERLQAVKKAFQEATEKFNEIKEVGFGDTEMDREVRNMIESKVLDEKTEGKVVRATYERLKKVLVDLRQGGMGLYQRLVPYHHEMGLGELPELDHRANISAIDAALDTVKMLNVTEAVLQKMQDHLSTEGSPSKFSMAENEEGSEEKFDDSKEFDANEENIPNSGLGALNCRIKPGAPGEEGGGGVMEKDDETWGDDFDELANDEEEDTGGINSNFVPTRLKVKKSSATLAGDSRRAAEAMAKRNKFQEMLDAADAKERADLTSTTANMKKQAVANDRLSQHHHPVGLPMSLTVRDDAMTKAMVFMTEMPHLE
ncbi:hypothetical protein TrRE_jg9128 [Triparma retinervis]|uniref:Uncharacterized protein n=1 Tax=Triparma retinervis TaxID=2557542 RepID=A0A9W7ADT8_9STRA|nr:hypothetical protein TrRE_jg9128 [Triparma retinervis]